MYRGYVKLWRKIIDSGWLKNHKLLSFWVWCLIKASHKEMDQIVGIQTVHLMPGDFIFGRKSASKELNISERSIRTFMTRLESVQNIAIKTTNKFSIISIINWDTYQGNEIENDQQNDQQVTNKRPASDHKQTHKNEKNIFIIPTVEQVRAYCIERGNNIDPEKFVAFYESNGWLVGKNKMKKWQSAIITWEGRDNERRSGNTGSTTAAFRKEKTVSNNGEQFPIDAEF